MIPKSYNVGGQKIEVRMVDRCDCNTVGMAFLECGYIEIANYFNRGLVQSEGSKVNTFYHELVHTILGTMGAEQLDDDEKFVCTFSSLLCEAMTSAIYDMPPRKEE